MGDGVEGTDKLRVKCQTWLFHTHTHSLSLSSICIYIQGARWAKIGERNVMQHDWRGVGGGGLENIVENLMAAGARGKGQDLRRRGEPGF